MALPLTPELYKVRLHDGLFASLAIVYYIHTAQAILFLNEFVFKLSHFHTLSSAVGNLMF